jgi:hypothetical protein
MDEEILPLKILNWRPTGRIKEGDENQNGNTAYSEL